MTRKQRILAVLVLLPLLAMACATTPGGDSEAGGEPVHANRIWPGFVPPARKHVAGRLPEIDNLAAQNGGVLFIGDSITEGAPLFAMFPRLQAANYGISWDTTDGLLLRLDQIRRNRPQRAFILIGTNDVGYHHSPAHIAANIQLAIKQLATDMVATEFYVVSILPREQQNNAVLLAANAILRDGATDGLYVYLDLASHVVAVDGTLREELTFDGLHLNVHGYAIWAKVLKTCVWNGCRAAPAFE